MNTKNTTSDKAAITGILAALAASSCCIPPVIALVAGVASTSLTWMEPLRPYLILLAIVAIGYAWYANLKPKQADDCGCGIEKPKFYQTRAFLTGMTLFAVVSISFPYYSGIFFPNVENEVPVSHNSAVRSIEVSIDGMTCDACQNHVNYVVNQLPGIIEVTTSYAKANAIIEFDSAQVNTEQIKKAVNRTGYFVTEIQTAIPSTTKNHTK